MRQILNFKIRQICYLSAAVGSVLTSPNSQVQPPPGYPPPLPAAVHHGRCSQLPPACGFPRLNRRHCRLQVPTSSEPACGWSVVQIRWWCDEPRCDRIWEETTRRRWVDVWETSGNFSSDVKEQKRPHCYLVLPTALWELTTSFRLFLGLGGSYAGNSPCLFLLMSSSPPCTSQVSWVTGVGSSAAFRSSLRMLWLYLDGSYFRVRALLPFWHLSCRTGRTRPNLLTTQS